MSLPDLPKQLDRKEAKFGVVFRDWINLHGWPKASTFELKYSETDSIPFSAVTEEQITIGAMAESEKGILLRTEGIKGMHDYTFLKETPTYIVIRFKSGVCFVSRKLFIEEKKKSGSKSLTFETASILAVKRVIHKRG